MAEKKKPEPPTSNAEPMTHTHVRIPPRNTPGNVTEPTAPAAPPTKGA